MFAGCPTVTHLTARNNLHKVENMKATFDIDEKVMRQLHKVAIRRGTTVSALVEEAIKEAIKDVPDGRPLAETDLPPLPSWPMGKPLVDISNREELYDAMEDWDKMRELYGRLARNDQ